MTRTVSGENTPHTHVVFFDSIRGLAALAVLASHYILAYGLPCKSLLWKRLWTVTPLHIWWDGLAAVSLFFVLSGLVLSLRYFRNSAQPDLRAFRLGDYLIARVCRIWLPYAAVLLISAVLQLKARFHYDTIALPPKPWVIDFWKAPVTPESLVDQIILFLPGHYTLVPQAWTLSVELILSFLVPVLILVAARSSRWLIFLTVLAIGPLGVSQFVFHFALGILIARHFRKIEETMKAGSGLRLFCLVAGILLYTFNETLPVYLLQAFQWSFSDKINYLCTGVGSAMLLLFVMGSPRLQEILSLPWLRAIGKVSYSIYLIHIAVLLCITPLVLQLFNRWPEAFYLAWFSGFFATIAATLLISKFSYQFIEVPSMAAGRRIIARKNELARERALK